MYEFKWSKAKYGTLLFLLSRLLCVYVLYAYLSSTLAQVEGRLCWLSFVRSGLERTPASFLGVWSVNRLYLYLYGSWQVYSNSKSCNIKRGATHLLNIESHFYTNGKMINLHLVVKSIYFEVEFFNWFWLWTVLDLSCEVELFFLVLRLSGN